MTDASQLGRQDKSSLSICMVADDFLPGKTGVGVHVQSIAKELIRRGHRISVITTRRGEQPAFEVWNGIRIYRVFSVCIYGMYQALPSVSQVHGILKENAVDIVHYHYLSLLLTQAYKAAKNLQVKHIYTYHMPVDIITQQFLTRPFRGLIFKLHVDYCNKFDLILVPSLGLIKQIRESGITTPVHFLSNPVMLGLPNESTVAPNKDKFVVLYVGRLSPEKNIPYLVKGFSLLQKIHGNCELWIIGEGDREGQLRKISEELGIAAQVKFLGFVQHDDLAQYYATADVFVLPSLVETQGIVAMEAMLFAKPVIVTNAIVGARELVDDGGNGFIVDPGNIEDLADKLIRLKEDPELRNAMGELGFRRSEHYGASRVVEALEQFYLGLF